MSGAVKGNMYHKSDKAQWNKIFDGVLYKDNVSMQTVTNCEFKFKISD